METIVLNLFGEPGAGKSTAAAFIYARLKMAGINAEYVTEFAKDKTWEHNDQALKCQPYVFGNQMYHIDRVYGKVEVIVTDSPLLLSAMYNRDEYIKPTFDPLVVSVFKKYRNVNYLLTRRHNYETAGRNETETESTHIRSRIVNMLLDNCIHYKQVNAVPEECEKIANTIIEKVKSERAKLCHI